MFEKLKEHIGEDVSCVYISKEEQDEVIGTLHNVLDYKYITIGAILLPIIGSTVSIKRISSMSGEILYENIKANKYYYNLDVDKRRRVAFGENYMEEAKKSHILTLTHGSKKNVK